MTAGLPEYVVMHRFANPARFMRLSATLLPWCGAGAAALLAIGLYLALFVAPPDYQQGEAVRIMFVHVPAAWMASFVYALMAVASAVALIWRHPLADIAAQSRGAARRRLHPPLPGHGIALGRADVGHLVGVGCAAHLGAGAVLPLSRISSRW